MSGPIHLPQDSEQQHTDDEAGTGSVDGSNGRRRPGILSVIHARSRRALFSSRGEMSLRALGVLVAIVASGLLGDEWTRFPEFRGYAVGFLVPWFAVFVNVAHLVFEPLVSRLLDALEGGRKDLGGDDEEGEEDEVDGDGQPSGGQQVAAVRRFRDRCSITAFWADIFVAVWLFIAAVLATVYATDRNPYHRGHADYSRLQKRNTTAGAILLYFLCVLTVTLNTGLIRQVSRIRLQFSLADFQDHERR